MRYCRFVFEDEPFYGKVEQRGGEPWIVDLAPVPEEDLAFRLARHHAEAVKALVTEVAAFDFEPMPLSAAKLLAPVTPSKIVCVGRNYRDHAKELGNEVPAEPLIFLKPPSSVIASGETIVYPALSQNVHYEGELGVIIGKRAKHVSAGDAWDYVFGYTCVNDVTARDLQRKDGQWTRGKGFDTFCPVGPWIVRKEDVA